MNRGRYGHGRDRCSNLQNDSMREKRCLKSTLFGVTSDKLEWIISNSSNLTPVNRKVQKRL